MMIEVRDLHKSFGSLEVLKGVNCSVEKSEVVCVIGHPAPARALSCAASTA